MKFKKTNGKHGYLGKRNDRFKRMFSKLGVKKDYKLADIFKQIEYEKKENHKTGNRRNLLRHLREESEILTERFTHENAL